MASLKSIIIVAVLAAALPRAFAQEDDDARAGLSRPMRTAIHFYEQGDDMQAMDRFMEILTKGDPSERSMANEYINLITHRMNSGGGYGGNPAPKAGVAAAEPASGAPKAAAPAPAPAAKPAPKPSASGDGNIVAEGASVPARRPAGGTIDEIDGGAARKTSKAPARSTRGDDLSSANKALMRKEIKARLHAAQERSLADLKAVAGVRVVMRENGDPEAIGIPSPLLFQSGIAFQRDAAKILDPLTKLVFALGSTQVLILPEGTAVGDAKVLDMRRTMGISSSLYQAGVAPPRVRVNLLNTQVDIPKSFLDFKGVVIAFQYDQPMTLAVESAVGDELGPPVSLGVFPQQIKPGRNQGAIIEFSVSDPPAGLVSWKFQLLQPAKGGEELAPLQEVVGGGPVFHQIFWNGRQNYFGQPLPAGRYECALSALDAKNRQRTLHKWIQVLPDEGEGDKLLASAPAEAPSKASSVEPVAPEKAAAPGPVAAPSEDLPGGSDKPLVKGVKPAAAAPAAVEIGPKPVAKPKRKVVARGVRAKKASKADKGKAAKAAEPKAAPKPDADGAAPDAEAAAPAAAPAAAGKPGHYQLAFQKDSHNMTPAGEKALAKAAGDLASYPLETLKIVGHSAADESGGEKLADDRAKLVASLLINRYEVEPKKIQVSKSAGEGATVELTFAKND